MKNIPIHNPFHHEEDAKHPAPSTAPKSSFSKDASSNDQSLHTILATPELRSALTLLVASISTQMRTDITAIFDPRFVTFSENAPLLTKPLDDKGADSTTVDVEKSKEAEKEREKIVDQLSQPEVQALKKEVLIFYDAWRQRVLARIGEVVNSEHEAKDQAHDADKDSKTEKSKPSAKDEDKHVEKVDVKTKVEESLPPFNPQAEKMLPELYPPIKNELTTKLDQAQRRLILHAVMLLLLSLENYAAYSRILLLNLCSSLEIPLSILSADESRTAKTLLTAAEMSADAETKKKADDNATSRKWKVGLATVAGAALIGVTGGLAAPLIALGVGEVLGGVGLGATAAAGYLGSMAGSSLLVGGLFGAYGGKMTGKMMDEYAKEVEDFKFIPVQKFHRPKKAEDEYRRLRVSVGISGWLTDKEDVVKPWKVLGINSIEAFALRFEMEALLKLGNSITAMLRSTAWAYAKKELIKRSIFGVLFSALWPIKLLKVASIVDNPFSVAMARADKAGEVLADALCNKIQGERPVTLIGYSLGARVIYTCLLKLAERNAFGLVESVFLLGMPAPADAWDWRQMRSVVAGRLVNAHSENDYVLAFLYRTASLELGVAGLQAVQGVKGIENVDVSDIVSGHLRYRFLSGTILKKIGLEDLDLAEVEEAEAELAAVEEDEAKERKDKEEKDTNLHKDENAELQDLQHDVEKRNNDSMMDWAKSKLSLGKDTIGGFFKGDDDTKDDVKKGGAVDTVKQNTNIKK